MMENVFFEQDNLTFEIINAPQKEVALVDASKQLEVTVPDYVTYQGESYVVTLITGMNVTYNWKRGGQYKHLSKGEPVYRGAFQSKEYNAQSDKWLPSQIRVVNIGDSVREIGADAFCACEKLRQVTIGQNVNKIGCRAFSVCMSLHSLKLPNSVTEIDQYAFFNCAKLFTITLGDKVKNIGDYAFCACIKLRTFVLPDSVETIGEHAFDSCIKLRSLVIPENVKTIGKSALSSALTEIYFLCDTSNINYVDCGLNIPASKIKGKDEYLAEMERRAKMENEYKNTAANVQNQKKKQILWGITAGLILLQIIFLGWWAILTGIVTICVTGVIHLSRFI